ncbi:unnamed protein product [Blepharisma stoltei]|uniref:LITAF domain-containing protein n=1 Tax=Blepharisma stoltei TaxID=1481888 RepID=A0AAU9K9A6_9CILI|nr:unnamed protein product [Blepharisma stoltei]
MSQRKPAIVELKPIERRSYPNEPEYPEQIEEFKIIDPLLNPPSNRRPNNLSSTPNIPIPTPLIQSHPPSPSPYLNTSTPSSQAYPNLLSPSPNIPIPTPQAPPQYLGQLRLIKCSVCSLMLQCSQEVCFVACPRCLNLTTTKQMIPMICTYCRKQSYFPIDAISIRCFCGAMYSNPYLRAN